MSDTQPKNEGVLGLTDLKRFIAYLFCLGFGFAAFMAVRFENRLNTNEREDHIRDVRIANVQKEQEDMARWRNSVDNAISQGAKNQLDLLGSIQELKLKISVAEEISRNIRDKVESMAAYMRSQQPKIPDPVLAPQQGNKAVEHGLNTADNTAVSNLSGYKARP